MLQKAVNERPDYITHHHGLGITLIEAERWAEADLEFQEVIALSLARDETHHLNDARYRRALCLNALGCREELEKVRTEIPRRLDLSDRGYHLTAIGNPSLASGGFIAAHVESGGTATIDLPGDTNIGDRLPWREVSRLGALRINLGVEVFPEFN